MLLPMQDSPLLRRADLAACRALLRRGSRSFHAASLLLPRRVREPASALYAFCRIADDAIDTGSDAPGAVVELRRRLERAYAGRPLEIPADRALADVIARFAIPHALPFALIEGLEWDAQGRRYETLDDLEGYAIRVAGTVGAMMTLLMGQRDPAVLARACDLGVAMQLTNIARDVGEDARAGRVYLPLTWLRDAGIDPDALIAQPNHCKRLASVVKRVLDAADVLYRRADAGIAALPADCRPAIRAARYVYAEIGREIGKRAFDSVSGRATVSGASKVRLIARSFAAGAGDATLRQPALGDALFLLDAIAGSPIPHGMTAPAIRWWNYRERLLWVLDLFERLERREQLQRSAL
ncbi:MAG: phytoene/squalene synthase family protein [Pseudorhodoplanes sp.]|nr:phytoene/squalene synthase family protein [Pseudorhodoplanes sp.]